MKLNRLLVTIAPEQPLNDSFHQAFAFANQSVLPSYPAHRG